MSRRPNGTLRLVEGLVGGSKALWDRQEGAVQGPRPPGLHRPGPGRELVRRPDRDPDVEGALYLASAEDLLSGRLLGFAMSEHPDAVLT